MRTTFSSRIALLALAASACVGPAPEAAVAPAGVQHVVVLWLKRPGDAADRAALIEASRRFLAIAGVQSVRVGPPLPSERPIVDDSFDVALVMGFADAAALERYQADPAHEAATREVLLPLVERLVVYDFVDR